MSDRNQTPAAETPAEADSMLDALENVTEWAPPEAPEAPAQHGRRIAGAL